MTEAFDPKTLRQWWAKPTQPKPIVIFGAGSIVCDAHLPAYQKGGFAVAGIFDPNLDKASALADQWGVKVLEVLKRRLRLKARSSIWQRRLLLMLRSSRNCRKVRLF